MAEFDIGSVIGSAPIAEVEYFQTGFILQLKFITKAQFEAMGKRHTKRQFNRKTHTREDQLDTAGMSRDLAKHCIKGWRGLTPDILFELVPIKDEAKESIRGVEEIGYTEKNAENIVANSYNFDTWLAEICTDISNFQSSDEEGLRGN